MIFTDDVLTSIGKWQRGWREQPDLKSQISAELLEACQSIPPEFKTVDIPCYRKRFLIGDELLDIVIRDEKNEGIASWTTDRRFAERFKDIIRPGTVSGAIFRHVPDPSEIILNIPSLWKNRDFCLAVDELNNKFPEQARPLLHFKDIQSEIILNTPLRGSAIIALSGVSSHFDVICDKFNIPACDRDHLFKIAIENGIPIQEPTYISEEGVQRVLENAVKRIKKIIDDEQNKNCL